MSEVVRIKCEPRLRVVPDADPSPSLAYEAEQRRRIMSRDWAGVHIRADQARPISISDRGRWKWR